MTKKKMSPEQILMTDLENAKKGLTEAHKMVDNNRENLSYDDLKTLDIIFILRRNYIESLENYLRIPWAQRMFQPVDRD